MNNDMLEAQWRQVGGQTRKWWGKLSDADLVKIKGKAERLADALQEKYGYTRQHAESQSNRWMHDHHDAPAANGTPDKVTSLKGDKVKQPQP